MALLHLVYHAKSHSLMTSCLGCRVSKQEGEADDKIEEVSFRHDEDSGKDW